MNDYDLIEAYKGFRDIKTDAELAKDLDVTKGLISNIKKGRTFISEKLAARMASKAGFKFMKLWGKRAVSRIMYRLFTDYYTFKESHP